MRYVLLAHWCALLTLVLTLGACQKAIDGLPTPSSESVTVTSDYPSVAMVVLPGGMGLCTGTFVSSRAVLTAAHCTVRAGLYTVIASFGTFTSSYYETFNGNNPVADAVNDPNDVAIIYFDHDVADASKGQVSSIGSRVSEKDVLRMVGFGCNDLDKHTGTGVKRTGTNMVYLVDDYIHFNTPGSSKGLLGPNNRTASCPGDSGGIAGKDVGDGSMVLLGVTHAGGYTDQGIESEYVDMTRNDNRAFVARVNQAHGLGIAGF
jgi:hypothetical protein